MKKSKHINKILSFVLLCVFFIALTPWAALHQHKEIKYTCANEQICKHKVHISSHEAQCLICAAHFEKNYTQSHHYFEVYITNAVFVFNQPVSGACYTELIGTALRGPPLS